MHRGMLHPGNQDAIVITPRLSTEGTPPSDDGSAKPLLVHVDDWAGVPAARAHEGAVWVGGGARAGRSVWRASEPRHMGHTSDILCGAFIASRTGDTDALVAAMIAALTALGKATVVATFVAIFLACAANKGVAQESRGGSCVAAGKKMQRQCQHEEVRRRAVLGAS